MKKNILISTVVALTLVLLIVVGVAYADKPTGYDAQGNEIAWQNSSCTKIQDGTLLGSDGVLLTTGYDEWGYNYQAHMFNGTYCGASRGASCSEEYADITMVMKWNDAWLSNVDCDNNGKLDRHFGYQNYIGSGAWETNHQWGEYELNGQLCTWDYFVKIVAAPANSILSNGIWSTADGMVIGPAIWGEFAVIQEVYNDPCGGYEGISYNSEAPTGFGFYLP